MQSTLRNKLAAAALVLAPMAALVAAQPAAAQERDFHRDSHGHHVQADRRAPQIFDVTPGQGDRVSERGLTHISARYKDDQAGVDVRSVTLRVDGRNVTRQARIDGNDVRYSENLRPGRHVAELVVRDRAGNVARRSWAFQVRNDVRGNDRIGSGYGR
ncbi:MAG TPA: hypothetical protein VFM98_07560 [Ramlibacter sp.]|uniref:hypothetical protein n=1 Tax=Ramlibacter sp. TaxID=1917967 RepID=UPI002D7FDEDC|nr:hypothetical protein [Ramlibacter sp.]HET8745445.1 hypothetical protein [Ramlibacter sp.]